MRGPALIVLFVVAAYGDEASAVSKSKSKLSDEDQARVTMQIYSRCLVRLGHSGAAHTRLVKFLAQSDGPSADTAAAASLARPDCLRDAATASSYVSTLRFKPSLLRGAVFRTLYLERTAVPYHGEAVRPSEIEAGWSSPADDSSKALREFGECTIANDRTDAEAAVRADVASETETAAYHALDPALSRCLPSDRTMRFSRSVLEGVLSEALYRQLVGVIPVATAAGARYMTERKIDGAEAEMPQEAAVLQTRQTA